MSSADDMRRFRSSQADKGLVRMQVWVPETEKRRMVDYAKELCKQGVYRREIENGLDSDDEK